VKTNLKELGKATIVQEVEGVLAHEDVDEGAIDDRRSRSD